MASKHKRNRLEHLLQRLWNNHNVDSATTYGEPGYQDPPEGILFANWNNISRETGNYLEEEGYALEWSDEWTIVDDKAYRTSPDSYLWESRLLIIDGEYITDEEPSIWLEYATNNPDFTLPSWFTVTDLLAAGYELLKTGLESGLHPGQTDDPEKVLKEYKDEGYTSIVFRINGTGQFDISFECWAKKE